MPAPIERIVGNWKVAIGEQASAVMRYHGVATYLPSYRRAIGVDGLDMAHVCETLAPKLKLSDNTLKTAFGIEEHQ